jgi:hypothetical protein
MALLFRPWIPPEQERYQTLLTASYWAKSAKTFALRIREAMLASPLNQWCDDQAIVWRLFNKIGDRFKVQKLDEAEATEIKAQIEEDRRARLEVERQAALKKAEARAMIMQAEVAKKKEFEEKIKARREAQKAILDAELKAFARAQTESETKTDTADGVG